MGVLTANNICVTLKLIFELEITTLVAAVGTVTTKV